jgi:anti-sigma B factor antagonist
MSFKITENKDKSVVCIHIPKRLASDSSTELKKQLKELVQNGKNKIVMDLSDTHYMDSSGIGAIVSKIAKTRANKGDIRLANTQSYINDLLELTHINKILKTYPTVDNAVNSF